MKKIIAAAALALLAAQCWASGYNNPWALWRACAPGVITTPAAARAQITVYATFDVPGAPHVVETWQSVGPGGRLEYYNQATWVPGGGPSGPPLAIGVPLGGYSIQIIPQAGQQMTSCEVEAN